LASEAVKISEELSIKKTTVSPKGEVVKTTFFFPDKGKSVEASSMEEALKLIQEGGEKK
jgi:hypothetical protein